MGLAGPLGSPNGQWVDCKSKVVICDRIHELTGFAA
jgi:hypothetical protein